MKKHFIYFVSILIFSIVLCGAASAANIPVNNITGIQNAINTAHNGDTLNLMNGTYKEHDISVNKNLTITGPQTTSNNQPTAVIDAQKNGRVFIIPPGCIVTLKYLLIQNGNATTGTDHIGGGIYNQGTLNVQNCTIINNNAYYYGGEGVGCGGGIGNAQYSTVTLTDSKVYNNTAYFGGGISNFGYMNIINSNVYSNVGGGIHLDADYGGLALTNSNVYNNRDSGIYGIYGILTGTSCNIYNNTSHVGGGIYNYGCTMTFINCNIFNNSAINDGAGGGGIYNREAGTMILTGCNVYNNTVTSGTDHHGGGIYNTHVLTLIGSNVYNNTVFYGNGGGIYNFYGTATLTNSSVYKNVVTGSGGGICNCGNEGTLNLTSCNIYNNTAYDGGGISSYFRNATLTFCRIFGNNASFGPDINCDSCTVNATFNWWGSNQDPSSRVAGNVNVTPWLVLNITANPTTIKNGATSNITSDLLHDSNGGYHNPANGHIPDGIPVNFATTLGTINNSPVSTVNGTAKKTLTSGASSGVANVSTTADNQTVHTTITIDSPPTVTATDPVNNAANVARDKMITVTFSEPIKAGTMWIELYNTIGTKTLTPITTSISGNVLTIKHTTLLTNGTKYTLYLHTGSITDNAGNPLAGAVRYFTTSTDATAPTITSTDPANNAVNIARNKVITVTFNEPIKAGTMFIELYNTIGTKTLTPITTSISGNVLTINHTALLANGTKYTLILHTGSITDLAGNPLAAVARYFTTSTDSTAPTITSTDPANNAVNVARNKVITVTFNEPIKAGTMFIELYNTIGTKTLIPITTSISGNVLTINHTALLANGTKYTLYLHTGSITDNAGNPLAGAVRYFTTSTDATAPTITSTDPANNAVNVARNKVITVTFNEPIKAGTMWIELYNTIGTKTLIPITTSISGNVLTINHTPLLANGTKYTLYLHTGSVTDLVGNSLIGVVRYFTTGTT